MEHLSQILSEIFQNATFNVRLKDANVTTDIKVVNFSLRLEKYSGDHLLYVKTDFEPQTLRDRKAIEKAIENFFDRNYRKEFVINQVIVPLESFWSILYEEELTDSYNSELFDFILHKLNKRIFRIKQLGHVVRFKVHPYKIKKNTLFVDVRDFSSTKEGLEYKYFKKHIETEVLEDVYHLGIRKVELLSPGKSPKVLSEGSHPSTFLQFKEYNDYITPIGILSFTLVDVENKNGIITFQVKDLHCKNGVDETYVINDQIKAQIERIVKDDAQRYGFKEVRFAGQANTVIK